MVLVSSDHWLFCGDGMSAQILDYREVTKKETGIRFVRFLVIPSKMIEITYNTKDKQDKATRAMVVEYPATEVIFLQRGTTRTRVWVVTDFLGGETVVSRRTADLSSALNDTARLLRSAEAAKARAYYELDKERQQQILALRSKIDMVKEVAKARGRLDIDENLPVEGPSNE